MFHGTEPGLSAGNDARTPYFSRFFEFFLISVTFKRHMSETTLTEKLQTPVFTLVSKTGTEVVVISEHKHETAGQPIYKRRTKMKRMTATLLATIAICMLSFSAMASGKSEIPSFDLLDADRNGLISSEEAASCNELVTDFTSLDTNQDGMLDQDEYAAFSGTSEQKG